MTESWEEKTERLEREYQARIDSLKHSCERAVSDFHTLKAYSEETESQLRKRVTWLEGVVESKEKLQAWLQKTLTEANSRITNLTIDFLSQLEAKDKRVAELEQRLLQLDVCWHCRDCILPAPKPRCEHCPDECDVEGCDAPGCLEHSALSRIELPKDGGS